MKYLAALLAFICFFSEGKESLYSDLRFISVDEAPANYYDETGGFSGYVTQIVEQLQKQLQIENEIEVMPEARAMRTLDTKPNVIMFSISRTKERESNYHWLAHVLSKRWIFYSRIDSYFDISSIQDIRKLKAVGVIRGDIREKWLRDNGVNNVVSILNYDNGVAMLMRGRIDLLFYESFGILNTLQKLGYKNNSVTSQFVTAESDVYIVMSKSENSVVLTQKLQKQLSILQASDWYKSHIAKWRDKLNEKHLADAWIKDGVLKY